MQRDMGTSDQVHTVLTQRNPYPAVTCRYTDVGRMCKSSESGRKTRVPYKQDIDIKHKMKAAINSWK